MNIAHKHIDRNKYYDVDTTKDKNKQYLTQQASNKSQATRHTHHITTEELQNKDEAYNRMQRHHRTK